VLPLEQVVAQQVVLWRPAGEARLERGDVVDPLPGEDGRAEEVLVHVERRVGVEVEPLDPRIDPREGSAPGGIGEEFDARLEDRVPCPVPRPPGPVTGRFSG
jgi:hypothetical protein